MRKSDKKIDNQLRQALTNACDVALKQINGFEWLTHVVNYDSFPKSLKIICVFDTNESLAEYLQSTHSQVLYSLVQFELKTLNINIKEMAKPISYDTEENCEQQNKGNWAARLA